MKYYKTDSRRISFREYWNMSNGAGLLVAWINKLFGIPIPLIKGIPGPQHFRDKIVEPEAVPEIVLKELNSGIRDLQQLGFDQFWFYTSKNSLTGGIAYGVQALHPSHEVLGKILSVSYRTRKNFVLAFFSVLADGTMLVSTNKKPEFNNPAKCIILRQVGADASRLWELHQSQMTRLMQNNPAKTFKNLDEIAVFEDENIRRLYEDKIKRGVWVEMTEAEVIALRSQPRP